MDNTVGSPDTHNVYVLGDPVTTEAKIKAKIDCQMTIYNTPASLSTKWEILKNIFQDMLMVKDVLLLRSTKERKQN